MKLRKCPAFGEASHRSLLQKPNQPLITCRRTITTTRLRQSPPRNATEASARLLESFQDKTITRRQIIDANQVQKLALTLGRPTLSGVDITDNAPPIGTPVPPGYHLVYFTPNGLESELGSDGTDRTFNAPAPFSRRMWAGGIMSWATSFSNACIGNGRGEARDTSSGNGGSAVLRVGDEVEERTTLRSATAKKSRNGGEMILVEVDKELWGPRGLSLVDRRSWIFRPEIGPEAVDIPLNTAPRTLYAQPTTISDRIDNTSPFPIRDMTWSSVGLFRFSALTFNGHKIHYHDDWAQAIEGHPGVVVHGPLTLINMLNYWRDVHGTSTGVELAEVKYRATAPVYAGEEISIRTGEVKDLDDGKGRIFEILVEKGGQVCMKGEIRGDVR